MGIKFYARPNGDHIHSDLDCSAFSGGRFTELGYQETTLDEAFRKGLKVCACVGKMLGRPGYLTVMRVKRLVAESQPTALTAAPAGLLGPTNVEVGNNGQKGVRAD